MIEERVIELIKDELNIDNFDLEDNLVDTYEVDSISLLDFFMMLEDEYDIEFEDDELEKLKSAQDIINLIEKKTE
ncbi:MAG: phosphopantetheine-binding protein [Tissierellia bacterium]|nr:phosphopantetheine-binding protein [Tissierellia bacterium]